MRATPFDGEGLPGPARVRRASVLLALLLPLLAGCEPSAEAEWPSPEKKPELVFRFALQPNPLIGRVQPVYDDFFEKHKDTLPGLPKLTQKIRKEAER